MRAFSVCHSHGTTSPQCLLMQSASTEFINRAAFNSGTVSVVSRQPCHTHHLQFLSFPASCTSTAARLLQVYTWDEVKIGEECDYPCHCLSPPGKRGPGAVSWPGAYALIRIIDSSSVNSMSVWGCSFGLVYLVWFVFFDTLDTNLLFLMCMPA